MHKKLKKFGFVFDISYFFMGGSAFGEMTKNYQNHINLNSIDCQNLANQVKCFRCGTSVSKSHLFCAKCGIKIHKGIPIRKVILDIDQKLNKKICFVCGTAHERLDSFCTNCGMSIKSGYI